MELRLDTCLIRNWRPKDEEALLLYANDIDIWRNLTDRFPFPYTKKDARAWIDFCLQARPPMNFAIDVGGEAVGGIGIGIKSDVRRRSAEIGYWLAKKYWGKGICTEALKSYTEYAFANFDVCRLEASVFEWNPASMRVLEKAGYEREARLKKAGTKDGQTIDLIIYATVR